MQLDFRNIYRRKYFWPFDEIIALIHIVGDLIYFTSRKDDIRGVIYKISQEASENAKSRDLTSKQINELKDTYKLNADFFSFYFKFCLAHEKSFPTLKDKLDFCINKYNEEMDRNGTARKSVALYKNFINGAKSTLKIYYLLIDYEKLEARSKRKNAERNRDEFTKLFFRPSDAETFMDLLNNSFLDQEKQLKIEKGILAGYLNHLQNRGVVKNVFDKEIRENLRLFNINIPKSTYSTGKNHPLEQHKIDWLNKKFPVSAGDL